MFLKRFKEKSNQKYINKLLNSRTAIVDDRIIESVGIIVNFEEFNNYEELLGLFESIGINQNKIKFITFLPDEKTILNSWDVSFSPKDIGWQAKVLGANLRSFIDQEFDALVSYYKSEDLNLNMITALSKANFKIGISSKDERLNDFIVEVEPEQIHLFKEELSKYLKVLKKI